MPDFLDVVPGKQKEILTIFKKKLNITWDELAGIMNLHRSSIFNYCSDRQHLSVERLKRLCALTEISFASLGNFDTVFFANTAGPIKLPNKNSVQLAELCGILLGDGCIFSDGKAICVSGHKIHDYKFLKMHVSSLFQNLFRRKPYVYLSKTENSMRLVVYSKEAVKFLLKYIFVMGEKKKAKAKIPDYYFNDNKLFRACLRGLSDTDGTVCPHPHTKIMYCLTITIPELMSSAIRAYKQLNFSIGVSGDNIYFYGEKKLTKFFEEIGSSNSKHLVKWKHFKKTGIMLRATEAEQLLK